MALKILNLPLSLLLACFVISLVLFHPPAFPSSHPRLIALPDDSTVDNQKNGVAASDQNNNYLRPVVYTSHVHITDEPSLTSTQYDNLFDVTNSTLGTQGVFLITLPTRRDKRDSFAVQSRVSNITYTVIEGVDGSTVPAKSLPYGMTRTPNEIGCWRAHLNIMDRMIEENLQTVMVFEDDADWDVSLKKQLVEFAKGVRYVTNTTEDYYNGVGTRSPYGDDWDILWIGHCSTKAFPWDRKRWVIEKDNTAMPWWARTGWDQLDLRYWDTKQADGTIMGSGQTRVVSRASWGSCTSGYILSLRGAVKVLYHLSMSPNDWTIDDGMGRMCEDPDNHSDFKCITVFPTLVGVSKAAGQASRWSDVGHDDAYLPDQPAVTSHSEKVVFSTRQNLERLLVGETLMKSEFPQVTGEDTLLNDIGIAQGRGLILEYLDDTWDNGVDSRRMSDEQKALLRQGRFPTVDEIAAAQDDDSDDIPDIEEDQEISTSVYEAVSPEATYTTEDNSRPV